MIRTSTFTHLRACAKELLHLVVISCPGTSVEKCPNKWLDKLPESRISVLPHSSDHSKVMICKQNTLCASWQIKVFLSPLLAFKKS